MRGGRICLINFPVLAISRLLNSPVSNPDTQKTPPLLGWLWWHEVPLLALIAYGFYQTDESFRGSPWAVGWFGAGIVAGVVLLILRCGEHWKRLPNGYFFLTLATVWTALFTLLGNSTFGYLASNSIFAWAFDIYTSPIGDEQFGLFIPFAVLGLFWWKREKLTAQPLGLWWPGILLVAGALLLHLVGYVVQQPRLSMLAFIGGLYGLTGLAWGRGWLRHSLFPFFLLLFCVPPFGMEALTFQMRLLVSWIVEHIAHAGLAPDLIRDGTQLFDAQRTFAYEVAAACSGIRSLTALLALTTIYGFVAFRSPVNRALLISSALPLAILGNVARLCFTIMVAEVGGQAAGKAVETNAGFVTFAVAIGAVYLLARWLEKRDRAAYPTVEEVKS